MEAQVLTNSPPPGELKAEIRTAGLGGNPSSSLPSSCTTIETERMFHKCLPIGYIGRY